MPTENPKISSYVPKVVYERFKQFQEERKLSMSQAVIELLAEYFAIDLSSGSSKETGSGLLSRIQDLEQVVSDLKRSYNYLMNKVDSLQFTSELQESIAESSLLSKPLSELQNDNLPELFSEPTGKPDGELLSESFEKQENQELPSAELPSELKSKLPDSSPLQLGILDSNSDVTDTLVGELNSGLPSKLSIKIDGNILAKRLNTTVGNIRTKRSTVGTTKQFTEWTTKKDVDKIAWKSVKEGKSVYFVPDGDLSDEQQINLQEWLNKNQATESTSELPVVQSS